MSMVKPIKTQTPKIIDDPNVLAGRCPSTGISIQSKKIGTTMKDDTPLFKPKRSTKLVQSSSLLDVRTDIQVNKIFSKVRLATENITKLFKTNHRVSPITGVHQYSMRDVHPPPPSPMSRAASRLRAVTMADSFPLRKAGLESIASLVACRHAAEEHAEDFVFILRNIAEVPSPSSPMHLLSASHRQRSPFTLLLNEPHPNEEEVDNPETGAERVYMEQSELSTPRLHVPLRASDSEAECDAMLAAEFAVFSFDSGDVLEWSDEVEREKQAKMDAYFAYVSEALAVPVPKISAYFADSPADFTDTNEDGFISHPPSFKTEPSEANTSADSSLVTSIDGEENRPSPTVVCGLRRVKNHGDPRSLHLFTDWSDSCSDLFSWSLDLGLSDSSAVKTKRGALRRSVKCNDLWTSFSSPESETSLSCEIRASAD